MPVGIFKQLAVKLYNKNLNLFTCAIPAFDFEFGNNLTETTKHFAEKVIELILQWSKEM
jgi:Ni,Fe-hydrogenase maturation factor